MLTTCLTLAAALSTAPIAADGPRASEGKTIANFKLNDFLGTLHALDDFAKSKLVVVAFLGADCPLANRYASRLSELAREYGPRGVASLRGRLQPARFSGPTGVWARDHKVQFPLLKDSINAVADQFKATRTPEVFVLDAGRLIRYRGRVDDQYGLGFAPGRPPSGGTRPRLLDELLQGRAVSVPVTEVLPASSSAGFCGSPHTAKVTYSEHITPPLQQRCVSPPSRG